MKEGKKGAQIYVAPFGLEFCCHAFDLLVAFALQERVWA
jgi:hypothetical protein